jgi:hypothetical protein
VTHETSPQPLAYVVDKLKSLPFVHAVHNVIPVEKEPN